MAAAVRRATRRNMPDSRVVAEFGLTVARMLLEGSAVRCDCGGIITRETFQQRDEASGALVDVEVLACGSCEFIKPVAEI